LNFLNDRVYDVTKFLDDHPGGEIILIRNSGIDATEEFEEIGHSSDAREMLKEYLIGELEEADKKGTVDTGPKSWASTSAGNENKGGWTQWIFLYGIALLASIGYRTVFGSN
jgi:cytochrome b involved in lipid metabolism